MGSIVKNSFALATAATLGACSHNAALRQEIGEIEGRLDLLEAEIAEGTAEIGGPGKDIRTRVSYRPIQQWASGFGTKTMTFRQNDRSGDLASKEHKCYWDGDRWSWIKRDGYRAWIHEDKSTKIDFTVGPLAFEPTDQGLRLRSDVDLWAKTQLAGAYRPKCLGWTREVTVGVEGRSRPTTVLELQLSQPSGLQPRYKFGLVSPKSLDVELRTGFQFPGGYDFDVRTTVTMENFARHLASGELDLLVEDGGEILMPDGSVRAYRLSTVDPTIETSSTGITLETDIELQRESQE